MAATATPIACWRRGTSIWSSRSGLKPHDIVALIPIVHGAGGIVSNWEGESAVAGGRVVAAGDKRVHAAALKLLNGS